MAGTASISSNFTINFIPTNTADTVIVNPGGRAYKIIGVLCNNPTGGALNVNVRKNVGGVLTAITMGGDYAAAGNTGSLADIDLGASQDIGATDSLNIQCSAATITVQVMCVATGGGTALTAT